MTIVVVQLSYAFFALVSPSVIRAYSYWAEASYWVGIPTAFILVLLTVGYGIFRHRRLGVAGNPYIIGAFGIIPTFCILIIYLIKWVMSLHVHSSQVSIAKKLFFCIGLLCLVPATYSVFAIYFSLDSLLFERPERTDLSQNWYCVIDEYRDTEDIVRIEKMEDWEQCSSATSISIHSDFDQSYKSTINDLMSAVALFSVVFSYGVVLISIVGTIYIVVRQRRFSFNSFSTIFILSMPFCLGVFALAGYVR